MVQVDLITGFLGAGKTTFLRRYAAWWAGQGVKVCVLENDFGAVNVDAMLLQDLEAQGVELETISGGCDCDTHQRRMRTKLISMAMRGFERVIVEPSGIFDVDEFFDVLRDEPLDRWYRLGNVIAIVDALLPEELSPQAEYILASESAWAGSVLLSRCQLASDAQKQGAEAHLARALEACKCSRKFGPEEIIAKDWADLTGDDMARIARCGCRQASCEKLHFDAHDAFTSAYFLELGLPRAQLEKNIPSLFTDPACGNVLRVKGFVEEDGRWYELNAAAAVWGEVPVEAIQLVGSSFTGVEHRIEPVRVLDGVTYYNDSIGTSPTRTIAGLRSFDQKVILIAGGYDKHIPYEPLAPEITAHVKNLVLMGATGPRIEKAVREDPNFNEAELPIQHADNMQHAVELARACAKPGDIIILSPASASFDLYPNFEVRGREFKSIVNALK